MINEQKARHMWADYAMQLRREAVLREQQVDAETSIMRLAAKNRKRALDEYLKTLVG